MKNSDYWKERFEQLNESLLNKGEEYYKSLDKEYRKAMNTIELQINNWYMRIANNNEISMAEAKKWLREKELEEFQWTVEEYIEKGKTLKYSDEWMTELENASARVHIRRLEALEIQLKQTVEELYQRQYEELSERLKAIYEEGYYHTAFEVQKGFNVGWSIPALDSNRVEKVVSKPWTSDGINFSDRIWKAKDDLINILHTELTQSIIMGKAPDQAIAKIAKKFNTSKTRAGRLIMTESAFFASVSQKDCFNELGVEEYKVCATLDLRTSEICRDMDGKVFKMSDYEPGITAPPFHCWCRTTTIPYFEDNVGERIARSSDGKSYYVPNNMTYREWYEKYVKSNPDELLAEKKYQNRHADKKQHASYREVLGKEVPRSLDAFQNLKYTDDKKWEVFKDYAKARKEGHISAFSNFDDYIKCKENIESQLLGVQIEGIGEIKTYSKHFIDRVLGTSKDPKSNLPRSGVKLEDVRNTLLHPLKIKNEPQKKSCKIIGEIATISINPETGNLIQCNPTDSDLVRRLKNVSD